MILVGSAIGGTGNDLANIITGNAEANILSGGDGNDRLNGGAGIDQMFGGTGDDTYYVDDAGDEVVEDAGAGLDKVYSSVDLTLVDDVENLILIGSAINGTGNALANVITGNAEANILSGGDGNDRLNGGAGIDQMIGGTGNDIYYVHESGDVVLEDAGAGTDGIYAYADYALGENVENLILVGSAIGGTGNDLANIITGNAEANILSGGDGNDRLNGGAGIDQMIGGTGNDIYYVHESGDVVLEDAGAGTDGIYAYADYALGENVENLALFADAIVGQGNVLANSIAGNGADNVLHGGDGNDTLKGNGGNDHLYGDGGNDYFAFGFNAGHDTIWDFDANPSGGQDRIDLRALGITTTSFAADVTIEASGLDSLITLLDGSTITVKGVLPGPTGVAIDMTDFKLLV